MNLNLQYQNHGLQKELLSEEFKALGFYISNHPLSEFKDILKQLDIISYDQFYNNNAKDGRLQEQ